MNSETIINKLTQVMGDLRPIPLAIATSYRMLKQAKNRADGAKLLGMTTIKIVPLIHAHRILGSEQLFLQIFDYPRLYAIQKLDRYLCDNPQEMDINCMEALIEEWEKEYSNSLREPNPIDHQIT